MTKSPTSEGISWAMMARAVTIPSLTSAMNAAAIRTPSTKLCTVSPIMIIMPLRP